MYSLASERRPNPFQPKFDRFRNFAISFKCLIFSRKTTLDDFRGFDPDYARCVFHLSNNGFLWEQSLLGVQAEIRVRFFAIAQSIWDKHNSSTSTDDSCPEKHFKEPLLTCVLCACANPTMHCFVDFLGVWKCFWPSMSTLWVAKGNSVGQSA